MPFICALISIMIYIFLNIMSKDQLIKAVNALKNISIDFTLDYHIFKGTCYVRGFFVNSPDDISKVKSILDNDILKSLKIKKSKAWYLGDEKEVIFMQLKEKLSISIENIESMYISNYA